MPKIKRRSKNITIDERVFNMLEAIEENSGAKVASQIEVILKKALGIEISEAP